MSNSKKLKNYKKGKLVDVSTSKLLKSVHAREYKDPESGEIVQIGEFVIEDKDFNFEKIWLSHLLSSIDALGSKKVKVAMFLMYCRDNENFVNMTYDEMAEATEISKRTIVETVRILIEENFMQKIRNGKYQINPDLVFKGGKNQRMDILISYRKTKQLKEIEKAQNELIAPLNMDGELIGDQIPKGTKKEDIKNIEEFLGEKN